MKLKWLIDNWAYICSAIAIAILLYLQLYPENKPIPFLVIILILISLILGAIDKFKENERLKLFETKFFSGLADHDKKTEKVSEQINENLKQQKTYFDEFEKRKKNAIAVIRKLIDRGVISEQEIMKHLPETDLYCLYCFTNRLPGKVTTRSKRLYPTFLEELGFVRTTGRSQFYITTKQRLLPALHDISKLKLHILTKTDQLLKEEWQLLLNELSKSDKREYERLKNKKYSEELMFNLLIFKTRITENNLGILNDKRVYNNDVQKILDEQKVIAIKDSDKVKVRKLVLGSSLELFFEGIPTEKQKIISEIEPELKQKLGIATLLDYGSKNKDDIKNILETKLPENAEEYAQTIIGRANEYAGALNELGISTTA